MENNQFKPLPFIKEIFLKENELRDYYVQKRKYMYENGIHIDGLKWRDKIHPILVELMSLNRKYIDKQTLTILADKRKETNKPVIFAITHIGKFDYQIVSEAIKDHQYPFAGDPETLYRSFDGFLLHLNGLVYCDTDYKEDRNIAKETSKDILKNNENLLIYPEGIWNLSSNLLSLPLFPGIIDMAMDTGCEIIPVAIEQYDNDFIVNIGENISINQKADVQDIDKRKGYINYYKDKLRQTLATLKFEIMESRPIEKRSNMGTYEEEKNKFVNSRLNEWVNPETKQPYYNNEILKERTFRQYEDPNDVFAFYKNMSINRNNAFLFRADESLPEEIEIVKFKELERGCFKR